MMLEPGHKAEYLPQMTAILDRLDRARRVILTSHRRPDGDALGSVLACAEFLEQRGLQCEIVFVDPLPFFCENLPNAHRIRRSDSVEGSFDLAVIMECDGIPRTGLQGLENIPIINIDHHASGRPFGEVNWIDPEECAVTAMVYRLALFAGATVTPSMATCLYAGVLSDTGGFTYAGTTSETFALAHDLLQHGADAAAISSAIFFANPIGRLRMLGIALSRLETEGPVAWSWVSHDDRQQAQASEEDCEGIVNSLIGIAGIEIAAFLREMHTGEVRLSLRSKGGINVAAIAERFNGGGHRSASGCSLEGPIEAATSRILNELRRSL